MFQTKDVEKIKMYILCSVTPPPLKIAQFMSYVEEYCGAGQATDDNVAHGHCILDD
jgi:hypothetical protein